MAYAASLHLPPLARPAQRRRAAAFDGKSKAQESVRITPKASNAKSKVQESIRSTPTAPNINDFFKCMSGGLREEAQDLDEEGRALKDQLRWVKKVKKLQRAQSSQRSPQEAECDRLHDVREGSASCAALPSSQQPPKSRPGLDDWQLHDELWEIFQDQPPEPLFVEAVPWPPEPNDILDFYEQVHKLGDLKKAYKLACRRWHPDKFLQRYGSVVPAKELVYMTFRVNEVFQAITVQWELTQRRRG